MYETPGVLKVVTYFCFNVYTSAIGAYFCQSPESQILPRFLCTLGHLISARINFYIGALLSDFGYLVRMLYNVDKNQSLTLEFNTGKVPRVREAALLLWCA